MQYIRAEEREESVESSERSDEMGPTQMQSTVGHINDDLANSLLDGQPCRGGQLD
jgi:hypothetical protein